MKYHFSNIAHHGHKYSFVVEANTAREAMVKAACCLKKKREGRLSEILKIMRNNLDRGHGTVRISNQLLLDL